MRKSLYFPACILMSGIVILHAQAGEQTTLRDSQKSIACEEASKNAAKIRVGMKESEVLDVLGSPTTRAEDKWSYDFGGCIKPPRAGEQVTTGVDIFFREGVVRDIRWAWVDATGPGVAPARKSRRKKHSR